MMTLLQSLLFFYGLFIHFVVFVTGNAGLSHNVGSNKAKFPISNVSRFTNRGFLSTSRESDKFDFWMDWLEKSGKDITTSIQTSLEKSEWWNSWESLHPTFREDVVKALLPFLISNKGWTIHCSDAYRLCQMDPGCAWKYWNYMSSCSSDEASIRDWNAASRWERNFGSPSHLRRYTRSVSDNPDPNSGRRLRRIKKRRKHKRKASINVSRRRLLHNKRINWKKATKALHYWMGRHWSNIYDNGIKISGRKCSSECLNALLMLNQTVYGALLARCDCKAKNLHSDNRRENWYEKQCLEHRAKAMKCRPRVFRPRNRVIGCTESRVKCESSRKCKTAQENFLLKCSQVINGVNCTSECRDAMTVLAVESRHFNSCVCDGSEKPVCHKIQTNIEKLCYNEQDCFVKQGALSSNLNCPTSLGGFHSQPLVSSSSLITKSNHILTVAIFSIKVIFFLTLLAI